MAQVAGGHRADRRHHRRQPAGDRGGSEESQSQRGQPSRRQYRDHLPARADVSVVCGDGRLLRVAVLDQRQLSDHVVHTDDHLVDVGQRRDALRWHRTWSRGRRAPDVAQNRLVRRPLLLQPCHDFVGGCGLGLALVRRQGRPQLLHGGANGLRHAVAVRLGGDYDDLPIQRLPPRWPRQRARELFATVYDGLAEAAQQHVRAIVAFAHHRQPGIRAHSLADLIAGVGHMLTSGPTG